MLRASLTFFFLGLLALVLGFYEVAGISLELGRLLLFVFLGLAILTFLGALMTGRTPKSPRIVLVFATLSYGLPCSDRNPFQAFSFKRFGRNVLS